ncbi:Transcription termination factor, mitochondrial/chloroplastic [Sesbania bispinosa]|nr:Transcription termination factor, mitochondrial/chloroplastic [Sesbania bispinosa]
MVLFEHFTPSPIRCVLPHQQFWVLTRIRSQSYEASSFRFQDLRKARFSGHYELLTSFLQSEKKVLSRVILCPYLLSFKCVAPNLNLLIDNNVATFNIIQILHKTPYRNIICSSSLGKTVQEVKDLGFDPSKSYFGVTLLAKNNVSKSKWDEKIDTYKRWGWSEEEVFEAFRRQPSCMLASNDKINRVMQFWINQLGWDSSYLVKGPVIFSYSLEKRVIPRASVLQYLLSKGLRSKRASLLLPFMISEKQFLQKFVKCFGGEETSQLMKLYKGKMNSIEDIGAQGNHDMSGS